MNSWTSRYFCVWGSEIHAVRRVDDPTQVSEQLLKILCTYSSSISWYLNGHQRMYMKVSDRFQPPVIASSVLPKFRISIRVVGTWDRVGSKGVLQCHRLQDYFKCVIINLSNIWSFCNFLTFIWSCSIKLVKMVFHSRSQKNVLKSYICCCCL